MQVRHVAVRGLLSLLMLVCALPALAAQAPGVVIRALEFGNASAWTLHASEDVHASLHAAPGANGRTALCLGYDFPKVVAGYVEMQHPLPLDFPAHYALRLGVRGQGPRNGLQLKFISADGWNVWWYQQPEFAPPATWTTLHIAQREVGFAWGPRKDHRLRHSAALQLTIAAVQGDRGELCFDHFALLHAPAPPAQWPVPRASASSALPGHPAALALAMRAGRTWRSAAGGAQTLTLDLGAERPLGGLSFAVAASAGTPGVRVESSRDGRHWQAQRSLLLRSGTQVLLGLPDDPVAHWLRLGMSGNPHDYALGQLRLRAPGWGRPVALLQTLARRAPRGEFPRGLSGAQNDWTVLGVAGGTHTGLISADGRIEPFAGGGSVEPFLLDHGRLIDWADARITQSLRAHELPVPGVQWRAGALTLRVTAFGAGTPATARLLARYTVRNNGDTPRRVTLALALRPLQVNPPQQFLNTPGGFGPIHRIRYADGIITFGDDEHVVTLGAPAGFVAGNLATQSIAALLAQTPQPRTALRQADGLAQGALLYPLYIPAHDAATVGIAIPWTGAVPAPVADASVAARMLRDQEDQVTAAWRARLTRVRVQLPPAAHVFQHTLYSALWQVLLDRDGAALQPGPRSYARSWIRDGAMMSEALLRMGDARAVRDYLLWYAPHQFSTGKVPCCVDWKGADPTPENDSQGELIFAIAEYTRYTHDLAIARRLWPHVESAVRYMNTLRATQKTAAYRHGERTLYYGLMPRSISHEGYSAKPMHSYWDDFWSLRGYRDAAWLAGQLGHARQQQAIARAADDFQKDFFASIRNAARWHHIDYIAGSADLGDFDPTSTTIALSPVGVQHALPQDLLRDTFARYWRNFEVRSDGHAPWRDYTPYEWRNVDAFVRLGWRARIPALLRFFFAGQRPAAWHQWAEVVWRDADAPHFIGDMPHAWVASDFLRSALDMLAYQRHRDHALVLAAGVPPQWLEDGGIRIEGLRTPWGSLSYHYWRAVDGSVQLQIPAGSAMPPGGLVLTWPYVAAPGATMLDGQPVTWSGEQLRITRLPAMLRVAAPDGSLPMP
ncbi:coagulation factor 5/8 type domain-containing protein [Metallibacterium scheffleri]|uniref:coagulation factor 5/8 type domain-containing protein n=1 Tax=Metallibacterium scheffleri TaxID=993689 RepID=UPI0023EF6705|nr:coagulation factor 5/8 type domain-containing protein [Metallibacterium scheffleri]